MPVFGNRLGLLYSFLNRKAFSEWFLNIVAYVIHTHICIYIYIIYIIYYIYNIYIYIYIHEELTGHLRQKLIYLNALHFMHGALFLIELEL